MKLKRLFAVIMAGIISLAVFAGCSKDEEEAVSDEYTGVLSKVRLGMPMHKIITLNSDTEMYYESDTEIWCVNPDTDLMELRNLIPAEHQFYYVEDSLVTYTFRYDEDDDENYLTGYLVEVPCLIDRETAENYYTDKIKRIAAKYSCTSDSVSTTVTGTEGVDLNLEYQAVFMLSSFEVIFNMTLTDDAVDGTEGYYATFFSMEVKELKNKTAVPSDNPVSSADSE